MQKTQICVKKLKVPGTKITNYLNINIENLTESTPNNTAYFRNYIHICQNRSQTKYDGQKVFKRPVLHTKLTKITLLRARVAYMWGIGKFNLKLGIQKKAKERVRGFSIITRTMSLLATLNNLKTLQGLRVEKLVCSSTVSVSTASYLSRWLLTALARTSVRVADASLTLRKIWFNASLSIATDTRMACGLALSIASRLSTVALKNSGSFLGKSGDWVSLRASQRVYGVWHRRYARRTKTYGQRRLLFAKHTKEMFGVNRYRFVRRQLIQLVGVKCARVEQFNLLHSLRLDVFLVFNLKVKTPMRAALLIRNGHVFVNGRAITTSAFRLSRLDVVTLSHVATKWLLRQIRRGRPQRFARLTKGILFFRKRQFSRRGRNSLVYGPQRTFAVLWNTARLMGIAAFGRRAHAAYSARQVRFILATVDF